MIGLGLKRHPKRQTRRKPGTQIHGSNILSNGIMTARLPNVTIQSCVTLAWLHKPGFLSDAYGVWLGNTIVALSPTYSEEREYTDNQLYQQEEFKKAIAYAKVAKDQPLYKKLAKGSEATAYNFAVADWFGEPEILSLEANGWTVEIGQTVQVKTVDDTKVTRVIVAFNDGQGNIFEQGEAEPDARDGSLWTYTTKTNIPKVPGLLLITEAYDLAGNNGSKMIPLQ